MFALKKENQLPTEFSHFIPVRKMESYIGEDGCARVLIPKFKNRMFLNLLPKSAPHHEQIKLDDFSTTVWIALDRKKDTSALIRELEERYGDQRQTVYQRVSNFLMMLYKQDLISFDRATLVAS